MNDNTSLLKQLMTPVSEVLSDAAEMGIDKIIMDVVNEPDLLKDIPIIKWGMLANHVRISIQSAVFIRKYANFIGPIANSILEERISESKIKEIAGNEEIANKITEETIIALDRYQNDQKAKMLGILFKKTFVERIFDIEEYNTLLFSIELMHPYLGIKCLKSFYDTQIDIESHTDEEEKKKSLIKISNIDFPPLANTALLNLPIGGSYLGSYGGARINVLGRKFYKNVVQETGIAC